MHLWHLLFLNKFCFSLRTRTLPSSGMFYRRRPIRPQKASIASLFYQRSRLGLLSWPITIRSSVLSCGNRATICSMHALGTDCTTCTANSARTYRSMNFRSEESVCFTSFYVETKMEQGIHKMSSKLILEADVVKSFMFYAAFLIFLEERKRIMESVDNFQTCVACGVRHPGYSVHRVS